MPTHTMRAVRLHEHGGPEVLRHDEVPVPEPGPGEVLVRVHAVGVNPPDWYLRDGLTNLPPETKPKFSLPVILGTDVSGVVEAVAADVDGLDVGDEVFGLLRFPSFDGSAYAEYVAAPASDLARKPAGIDLWLPAQMTELYEGPIFLKNRPASGRTTTRASYSNFKQFGAAGKIVPQ